MYNYLNEAFTRMNALKEDTFNVSDKGVADLADLRADDEIEDQSVKVIDPEATSEEDVLDAGEYVGKVILECPVCHSFIFNNKDELEIDVESHRANVSQDCPYCCEVGGFIVVGIVQGFDPDNDTDVDSSDAAEDAEDEDVISDDVKSDEDEQNVEEALNECDDKKTLNEIGDIKLSAPLIDGGKNNDVSVLSPDGLSPLNNSLEQDNCEQCDDEDDCEECDDKADEGILGPALAVAGGAALGSAVGNMLTNALVTVDNTADNKIKYVLNTELGIDSWTSFEYDDEDETVPVTVFNGEEKVGTFKITEDGKLEKVEVDNDESEESETKDADESLVSEDLHVDATDDKTVVSDGDKTVTISDNEQSNHELVDDEEENVFDGDAKIMPLTDDEKNEIMNDAELTDDTTADDDVVSDDNSDEDAEGEEVEEALDDFVEERFDYLNEKFLKRTFDNVESYKTTNVYASDSKIKLEGVITFKSGKTKNTSYILEARGLTRAGNAIFVGENAAICKAKKAFTLTGNLHNGRFLAESLNYNFRTKGADGKSVSVHGTVSNKK